MEYDITPPPSLVDCSSCCSSQSSSIWDAGQYSGPCLCCRGKLRTLLLVSELILEHISKIRVIMVFRSKSKFLAWVRECLCRGMWRITAARKCEAVNLSKSFTVYLYLFFWTSFCFSHFPVWLGRCRNAPLLQIFSFDHPGPFLMHKMAVTDTTSKVWDFYEAFFRTCSKFFFVEKDCVKQMVILPVACFGGTIYWPGNMRVSVCCTIGFKEMFLQSYN